MHVKAIVLSLHQQLLFPSIRKLTSNLCSDHKQFNPTHSLKQFT